MMTVIQALILGVLQGATEFLPISSSGHLVIVPWLLGWEPAGLTFNILVHWGTAFAVLGYFWREWIALARAACQALRARSLQDPLARLALLLVLGSVPAALVGVLFKDWIEQMFARPVTAGALLLVTAALLAASERFSTRRRELDRMAWRDALTIGAAQALAILPGISRSGATIAAGMGRDLKRVPAARFSFLLATPIILGAGVLELVDLAQAPDLAAQAPILLVGFVAALSTGLACIHFLLRYLERRALYPFAIYCALVGSAALVVALVST